MTSDIPYVLDKTLKAQISCAKNTIKSYLPGVKIYLFGSIAKGCYSKHSDIDFLILIQDDKSIKELRILRHEVEDQVENLSLGRKVDLKLYNESRYRTLCQKPCFEQVIQSDLIDVTQW